MTYFALFLGFPSACHILTLDIWMTNSSHILFHQMSLSLFLKIHFFLLCVSVFVPNVCICSRCILGVFKVHKRLLDLLEVEIWMVVSHHVDAGNWTQILSRATSALTSLVITPTPNVTFLIKSIVTALFYRTTYPSHSALPAPLTLLQLLWKSL